MIEAQLTSYEDIPYTSKPLYPTHPDCLATLATLLGMQPAPVARCRVLELGCAAGGNLIPMAEAFPQGTFVGIDLSPRQIADGQALVDAVGLKNIDLRAMSILDVDTDFGQFDYIICHGVYSWVPPAVQDKILEICRQNLCPQGVAYISYNTFPGWHGRAMVREMMGFHARQFEDPASRISQARAFLEFMVNSVDDSDGAYARVVREEADMIRPEADYYLFHEHLEDVNQPVYFHEFAERIAAKELQYLGEAWFHTNLSKFSPEVQATLEQLSGDLVRMEQYVDFLINRTFRRTLLCHGEVKLDRTPSAEIVARLSMSALVMPVSDIPEVTGTTPEVFRADDGRSATTNIPQIKAALVALFDVWPGALSFDTLQARVAERLGGDADGQRDVLAAGLLQCYLSNMVAFHVAPAQFELQPGPLPRASALVREQAARGWPIANRRHRVVPLVAADRLLLSLLDGKSDRAALAAALARAVASGSLPPAAVPEGRWDDAGAWLAGPLESSIESLARNALLVG